MKRFATHTEFEILTYKDNEGFKSEMDKSGNKKFFKTRTAAENYCKKHRTVYVEHKFIFYR